MIITKREEPETDKSERLHDASLTAAATGGITATDPAADDEMSSDEVFDQLEDEDHVVTSGRGSRLPIRESTGGNTHTGYSVGSGSGSGSD